MIKYIIFLSLLVTHISLGQASKAFKVVLSKSNTYKFDRNQSISENDTLILQKDDYILLSIGDSIYVELDSQGLYPMNSIMSDNLIKKHSNECVKYVVNQMQNNYSNYKEHKIAFFKRSSSVFQEIHLTIRLPFETFTLSNIMTIHYSDHFFDDSWWDSSNYKVLGLGINLDSGGTENIIYQMTTKQKKTKIILDTLAYKVFTFAYLPMDENQKLIFDFGMGQHIIKNLSYFDKPKFNFIKQEYHRIFNDSNIKSSLIQKLAEAYFFDKHELYIDAINSFEDAMVLKGSEIKECVNFYNTFFERHK
ncbi:MAG: hypothetical protein MUE81_01440 [Thermoflexibacter sp.]|jgi:hypothetical protein|nr:hypothetical protein [Thermoflexibacter sp.]